MHRVTALHGSLAVHRTEDPEEREHLARMLSLCEQGPAALSRSHFVPGHFTASAFVTTPARDALLLILHKKLGIWVQPGGHVEAGDADLAAAARRELVEELGAPGALAAPTGGIFDVDVHRIPPRPDEPGHAHFDVRYLFTLARGDVEATDEVAAVRWWSLAELAGLTTDASVRRAAAKLSSRGA